MSISKSDEKPVSTKKKDLWLKIVYLIAIVIFIGAIFKVVSFFNEQRRMKGYVRRTKEMQKAFSESTMQSEKDKEKDVPGEDIKDVPRYAGMVRTWYVGNGKSKMVVYEVKASKDELLKFYEKEMASGGWEKDKNKQSLTYSKDKKSVEIIIAGSFSREQVATVTMLSEEQEFSEKKSPQ